MENLQIKGTSVFIINAWLDAITESIKNNTFYESTHNSRAINAEIMARLVILKDIFPGLLTVLCDLTKENQSGVVTCVSEDLDAIRNVIKQFLV